MASKTKTAAAGDIIQVTNEPVVTCDERGNVLEVHGKVRAVAHALEIESDGWVIAWFERTSTLASVAPGNYKVLGGPETGRHV